MGEPTAKDLRRSTDRRVVRTRKAIREAFFKLMENQDYHKITIASVAREADIDRKTFYLALSLGKRSGGRGHPR